MPNRLLPAALAAGLLLPGQRAQGQEWQVQGLVTAAAATLIGAGAGVTARPGGRLRLSLVASAGVTGSGQGAVRGELLASVPADPYRTTGVGVYGGGGLALVASAGQTREYLVLLVGVESTPGRPRGWFVEAGAGGGLRLAVGYRVRGRRRG